MYGHTTLCSVLQLMSGYNVTVRGCYRAAVNVCGRLLWADPLISLSQVMLAFTMKIDFNLVRNCWTVFHLISMGSKAGVWGKHRMKAFQWKLASWGIPPLAPPLPASSMLGPATHARAYLWSPLPSTPEQLHLSVSRMRSYLAQLSLPASPRSSWGESVY